MEMSDPNEWRISKSGFSIRSGWSYKKRTIAIFPYDANNFDAALYQQWLRDAYHICECHNENLKGSQGMPLQTTGGNMKKLAEVNDEGLEGLEGLMGETVTLMCMNYFYTGLLVGVNDTCVKLDSPSIVYDTGSWSENGWADAQALPGSIYIQQSSIEAFGVLK